MNTLDVLRYGHQTLIDTLARVPQSDWAAPDVCGVWSVKDIVAHLASYELMLIDVLQGFVDPNQPTPTLETIARLGGPEAFNDHEVAQRQDHSPQAVYDEYLAAQVQTQALAAQISLEDQTRDGSLPWYGAEYDLQDYLVYTFYGHKREHSAQVAVFADTLG
jgi:uncharacterized damage-inducible protein DinB